MYNKDVVMLLAEAGYEEQEHNRRIEAIRHLNCIGDVIEAVANIYLDLYKLKDASEINQGMCEDFAEDVRSLISGAETYWDDELGNIDPALGSHKVIMYQGRYYDSQCPEGTENWRTLLR